VIQPDHRKSRRLVLRASALEGSSYRWSTLGLLVLIICRALSGPVWASEPPAQPTAPGPHSTNAPALAKRSWGRIVVIGASASAGFTEAEPLGGPNTPQFQLSRYLDAALLAPHEPVKNLANTFFFMQPLAAGRHQLQQALDAKPGLLIGLDFLFWFCYGPGTETERLERFEQGLKLLDPVTCPVVLGDMPDASAASNRMLSPEEIPGVETLAAANRRLKEWAAKRKQVTLVPLASFMRSATLGQALIIHGITVPEGKSRALLQPDRLHPSTLGAAVLALAIFDAFVSSDKGHKSGEVLWDPQAVLEAACKR